MTRPRQWLSPNGAAAPPPAHRGRRHLERRALAARRTAVDWVRSADNAEQVDAFVAFPPTALGIRDRPWREYNAVFDAWGVPGLQAPGDLNHDLAAMWARSVTIAVLRELGRRGAHPAVRIAPEAPRTAPTASTPTAETATPSPVTEARHAS